MTAVRHVIYLHGFCSSPGSSKAQRFARELAARGIGFDCPDLNEPAFETLTVTRMLDRAAELLRAVPAGPVALVGSSLGGFVALHVAATHTVDRLILLAPAVDFGGNRLQVLGEQEIDNWRRSGTLEVFHFALNEPRRVGFGLYEDAAGYDAFDAASTVPTLVFQGRRDEAVDPRSVEAWAAGRPHVDLRLIDDDHQLTSSMNLIWDESRVFLGLD